MGLELELEDGDGNGLDSNLEFSSPTIGGKVLDFNCGSVSTVRVKAKKLEEDLLYPLLVVNCLYWLEC